MVKEKTYVVTYSSAEIWPIPSDDDVNCEAASKAAVRVILWYR